IRSWVKEGLIHLGEVWALQGLASLAVEAQQPYVRGDYQAIARRRGMKESSVWDALNRACKKLGAERFERRYGRPPLFRFIGRIERAPTRCRPPPRATDNLERIYNVVMQLPVSSDGARRYPSNRYLQKRTGLTQSHPGYLLRKLHVQHRLVYVPA